MSFVSWLTSNSLVSAVKRKISIPISQGLMSEQDILDFATEELLIAQVPSVMEFHEEYFVWPETIPLVSGKTRYAVPERAIGMKLRDIWFKDSNNTLYEMTRIAPEDKDLFQRNSAGSGIVKSYYLQNNWIVLTDSSTIATNGGSLQVEYFLRPNRLVPDERASYIQSFTRVIAVDNTTLIAGDTVTIDGTVFTAVAAGAGALEFDIGGTSAFTAANLSSAIGTAAIILGSSSSTANITLEYEELDTEFEASNEAAFAVSTSQGVKFTDTIPSNITSGADVDFLQTRPGHSMRGFDVTIPTGGVSTNIITFVAGTVPEDTVVGDYVALSGEGIIPQIPTDLHSGLADRTCGRILAALGDNAGVESINQKLAETETRQSALLNNRVEGSLQKVTARHSLLRQGKLGSRWRF